MTKGANSTSKELSEQAEAKERIEHFNSSFSLLIVLTTLLAAAILEISTFLQGTIDPLFLNSLSATLRLLFLPLILIIILWVFSPFIRGDNGRIFMRIWSWIIATQYLVGVSIYILLLMIFPGNEGVIAFFPIIRIIARIIWPALSMVVVIYPLLKTYITAFPSSWFSRRPILHSLVLFLILSFITSFSLYLLT